MATVLKALDPKYYNVGKGAIFLTLDSGVTYRLGDPEQMSINIEETTEEIFSNEHDVKTQVGVLTSERKVTVTVRIKQLSPIVRAASVQGSIGNFTQSEEAARVFEFATAGIHEMNVYGVTVVSVVDGAGEPVQMGDVADGGAYLIDARTGLVETFVPGLVFTVDVPEITERFATGIASGSGLSGKLQYVGTNKQGVRSHAIIWRVENLRNTAGRDFISDSAIQTVELTGTCVPVSGKAQGLEIGVEVDLPGFVGAAA